MCYKLPITKRRRRQGRFSTVLTPQDRMHFVFSSCFSIASIKRCLNWTWWNSVGRLLWSSCGLPPSEEHPSAGNTAQSCEHRAAWRPPCMGPATLGTVTAALHRLGRLTVYGRSTGSSLTRGEADNGSPIKYLQALDFLLTFNFLCEIKFSWKGETNRLGGNEAEWRQPLSKLLCPAPPTDLHRKTHDVPKS